MQPQETLWIYDYVLLFFTYQWKPSLRCSKCKRLQGEDHEWVTSSWCVCFGTATDENALREADAIGINLRQSVHFVQFFTSFVLTFYLSACCLFYCPR